MSIAHDVIELSASTGEIRHIDGNRKVMSDLLCECDDHAETVCDDGLTEVEYWGVDEDGRPWRVHVRPDGN